MEYSLAKGYVKRRRIFSDIIGAVFIILFACILVLFITYSSIGLYKDSQKFSIVRDTIYIKVKQQVKITGPDDYVEYIDDEHGLQLRTSDGKYILKVIDR